MCSWCPVLSPSVRQTFLRFALLVKCGKQRVQIGGWAGFALLFSRLGEQSCHGDPFVNETANVALWLGQTYCLREGREGLRLFVEHLMSQSLQDPDLNHVAPALARCRSLEYGPQSLQGEGGLVLCQVNTGSCHLFSFVCKRIAMPLSHIHLFDPLGGPVHFATGQPESDLINSGEERMDMDVGRLVHAHADMFILLEGRACGIY